MHQLVIKLLLKVGRTRGVGGAKQAVMGGYKYLLRKVRYMGGQAENVESLGWYV